MEATTSDEEVVQMEALRQLHAAEVSPEIARALRHLVESSAEGVRLAALPVMAERGQARVLPTLVAHAEKRHESLSSAEAEATGRALATSSPRGALDTFKGWLELKGGGLLGRKTMDAPATLQRVALAGLERIGGGEANELLDRLAEMGAHEVAAKADGVIDRRGGSSGG
jgi:HEAT repeat protein